VRRVSEWTDKRASSGTCKRERGIAHVSSSGEEEQVYLPQTLPRVNSLFNSCGIVLAQVNTREGSDDLNVDRCVSAVCQPPIGHQFQQNLGSHSDAKLCIHSVKEEKTTPPDSVKVSCSQPSHNHGSRIYIIGQQPEL